MACPNSLVMFTAIRVMPSFSPHIGEEMIIKEVVIKLSPEEALRLTRILVDEDSKEAMLFLKECLKPKLDKETRGH